MKCLPAWHGSGVKQVFVNDADCTAGPAADYFTGCTCRLLCWCADSLPCCTAVRLLLSLPAGVQQRQLQVTAV
jgi:hypothetical protein